MRRATSYKLKILGAESITNSVLCFCHNAQDSRGDISWSSTEI